MLSHFLTLLPAQLIYFLLNIFSVFVYFLPFYFLVLFLISILLFFYCLPSAIFDICNVLTLLFTTIFLALFTLLQYLTLPVPVPLRMICLMWVTETQWYCGSIAIVLISFEFQWPNLLYQQLFLQPL